LTAAALVVTVLASSLGIVVDAVTVGTGGILILSCLAGAALLVLRGLLSPMSLEFLFTLSFGEGRVCALLFPVSEPATQFAHPILGSLFPLNAQGSCYGSVSPMLN